MNFNKKVLVALTAFGFASLAHAADTGHGKVTFTGSVIDAPCSISPGSSDQTVELGQISSAALKNGGQSTPREFSIELENCSLTAPDTKNKVAVTFSGMESKAKNGRLGIYGTAKGASIAITDAAGREVVLGKPSESQVLLAGNNTLSFAAYLQGDPVAEGASEAITEGTFQSVAGFTMAYN